jgi:CRP-like cAMP-binding protein
VTCEVLADRIRYEARVTVADGSDSPGVSDAFTTAVWYAARRAGVPLPLPQAMEMQLRDFSCDPEVVVREAEAQLRRAEGMRVLPGEAIARIATACERVLFGAGEQMLAAGEIPRYVYVIIDGEAAGSYGKDTGAAGAIHFGSHEVLGVTSLARAQASDARVVALTDVTALRIPGAVVGQALQEYPSLSKQFARIWQARSEALRRSAQHESEIAQDTAGRQEKD